MEERLTLTTLRNRKLVMDQVHQSILETHMENWHGNVFHWQEQSRQALNFQQAVIERAVEGYAQAARGEVPVAVAQVTEMSGAEMREIMGALENEAEQTWTSHQVTLLKKMSSVERDALENREKLAQ